MEVLFENQYISTKKQLKEFYSYFLFKKPFYRVLYAIIFISFVSGIVEIIFPRLVNVNGGGIANVIIAVLITTYMLIQYHRIVKIGYAQELELNQGKETEVLIRVTADEIELHNLSSGAFNHIAFSQIVKAIETKSLYMLSLRAKIVVVFRKDSFTVGTLKELKGFIKEHCLTSGKV